MIRLLYGTTNPAKLTAMRDHISPLGIDLIGLEDLEGAIPQVAENGSTPLENARMKAHAYYEHYRMPVFSCDSGLYLEGLPKELQPGIHVRTVSGKYLSDEEMLSYYSGLAKAYGDLTARYVNAICLVLDAEHIYESMDESLASEKFILTAIPYPGSVRKGFPLDSLSKEIASGKYYYELNHDNADALVHYPGFVEFFRTHMRYFL